METVFSNKKAIFFQVLPHHVRILKPVADALTDKGMEIIYTTASAEAAFEITLNQAGLPYRHACSYMDEATAASATKAARYIRDKWQGKIIDNLSLQAVPIPIQDKVVRSAVDNLYAFSKMLAVEKPDIVFSLQEINSWGKTLGYLCFRQGIPYVTFQEGLCYAAMPLYRFHTEYSTACVIWGQHARRMLEMAGCGPDKIFELGAVDIWPARERCLRPSAMCSTFTDLQIPVSKRVVLFLMSHSSYREFEAKTFLDWLDKRGDITAIFKWHPGTAKATIVRALSNIPLQERKDIYSLQDYDTYALMGISEVCVVAGISTTGIEALTFYKPLIEIVLPDQLYSYAGEGVAELAMGFEDLPGKIDIILEHGVQPERQERIKGYLQDHFTHFDGKTVDRVVEMAAVMFQAKTTARPDE